MQAVRGRLMAGIDYTPTSAQELVAQQQPGPHSKARQEPAPEVLDESLALTLSLQVRLARVVLIQHQLSQALGHARLCLGSCIWVRPAHGA